jgi:hypothetical protein
MYRHYHNKYIHDSSKAKKNIKSVRDSVDTNKLHIP